MQKYIKNITHNIQSGFIQEILKKCKSINVLNELNDKNHMVISIGPLTKSSMPS